jgi:hypothetical protein
MPDRPILFSAPMVRAILRECQMAGSGKTETRRIIRPRGRAPSLFDGSWSDGYALDPGNASWRARDVRFAAGDRLWVRETIVRSGGMVQYEANRRTSLQHLWPAGWKRDRRSSIHMPRAFSRLTLYVEEVRVERLHAIDEAGAVREGIAPFLDSSAYISPKHSDGRTRLGDNAYTMYRDLWNDLHGPGAWDANPWVAVVRFRPRLANIAAAPAALAA